MTKKKWWSESKGSRPKVDPLNDITAILEFLEDVHSDETFLTKYLKELAELEKEFEVGKQGVKQVNLQTQSVVLSKLLERYEFFLHDVAINGNRLKLLAEEWFSRAKKAGMKDLVNKNKNDHTWKMQW